VDKIQRLKFDKVAEHNKTAKKIKLIQLKRIRERILNGYADGLIEEYHEIVKLNKEIAIYAQAIQLGQNYDTNIRRVNRLRQRKLLAINKIIKISKHGNE